MGETPARCRPFTLLVAMATVLALLGAACSGADDDADASEASGSSTPGEAGDGTDADGIDGNVTVLTYNVAGLPQEISSENPEENMPKISPLLNDYDIVLTQEDFDWWKPGGLAEGLDFNHYHERLRAEADHPYGLDQHPGPEAAGIDPAERPDMELGDGIGILSTTPLEDQVRQAWTGCFGGFDTSDGGAADCLAMKGFAVATTTLGGVEVDVYSFHAEAGGTDEDQRLQEEDYEQLAAFIEEHSADRAIILGGDTNLHLDPERDDANGDADATIWAGFLERTGLTDACDATGDQCADPFIIDKIAVRSSDDITLEVTGHEIPEERFSDDDGEPLSDHRPVVATVRWTTAR